MAGAIGPGSSVTDIAEERRAAFDLDGFLVLPGFVPEATPIYILHPHRERVPAKVRAFVDFLLDAIPESLNERAAAP